MAKSMMPRLLPSIGKPHPKDNVFSFRIFCSLKKIYKITFFTNNSISVKNVKVIK